MTWNSRASSLAFSIIVATCGGVSAAETIVNGKLVEDTVSAVHEPYAKELESLKVSQDGDPSFYGVKVGATLEYRGMGTMWPPIFLLPNGELGSTFPGFGDHKFGEFCSQKFPGSDKNKLPGASYIIESMTYTPVVTCSIAMSREVFGATADVTVSGELLNAPRDESGTIVVTGVHADCTGRFEVFKQRFTEKWGKPADMTQLKGIGFVKGNTIAVISFEDDAGKQKCTASINAKDQVLIRQREFDAVRAALFKVGRGEGERF